MSQRSGAERGGDWRLEVDLHDGANADLLAEIIASEALIHDMSLAFKDRVIASREGSRIYFYAGDRQQCDAIEKAARAEALLNGWELTIELRRWHHYSEEWQRADIPIPTSESDIEVERADLQGRERSETAARGYPEFEVRADLPSHHAAKSLSEELSVEGLCPIRRWKYVIVGVTDEVTGEDLATRIELSVPGSRATVEGTITAVRENLRHLRRSPLSWFDEADVDSRNDPEKPSASQL
jgi:hypothetical protein